MQSQGAVAPAGGVKRDDYDPQGDTSKGFGHVPFHRDEYTGELRAYFNVDLAQIRGFRLGGEAETLLVALALFKIQRFLRDGLRLRTACDLEPANGLMVRRPAGFSVPGLDEIEAQLPDLIRAASEHFAQPPVTKVQYRA